MTGNKYMHEIDQVYYFPMQKGPGALHTVNLIQNLLFYKIICPSFYIKLIII